MIDTTWPRIGKKCSTETLIDENQPLIGKNRFNFWEKKSLLFALFSDFDPSDSGCKEVESRYFAIEWLSISTNFWMKSW